MPTLSGPSNYLSMVAKTVGIPLTCLVYRAVSYRGGVSLHPLWMPLDSKLGCCSHFFDGKWSKIFRWTLRASRRALAPGHDIFHDIPSRYRANRNAHDLNPPGECSHRDECSRTSQFGDQTTPLHQRGNSANGADTPVMLQLVEYQV